jgi:hypothetical protein
MPASTNANRYFPIPTKCPFDGCRGRSIVTETRQRENWIYRLRRCHKDPSHRWSTEELTTKMWEKSVYKTYDERVTCPEGHQFTVTRQSRSEGRKVRTICPQCKKVFKVLAGKMRHTRVG